jgi:hypothetical protein
MALAQNTGHQTEQSKNIDTATAQLFTYVSCVQGPSGGRISYAHRRKRRAGKGVTQQPPQPAAEGTAARSGRRRKQVPQWCGLLMCFRQSPE